MNNIIVKIISSNDTYTFQTELQKYLDSINTDIFDVEIQYQTNNTSSTNTFIKTQYSALIILRRSS